MRPQNCSNVSNREPRSGLVFLSGVLPSACSPAPCSWLTRSAAAPHLEAESLPSPAPALGRFNQGETEKLLPICCLHETGDQSMGAGDPGVAEDRSPADQFMKGWAGRGEDTAVCHGDPTKIPKMQRTSHGATGMQIQASSSGLSQGEGDGPHLGVQDRVEFQPHCVVTESLSGERETHSSGAASTERTWAALPTKRKSMRPRPAGPGGLGSEAGHCWSLVCGQESLGSFLGFPTEVRPPKVSSTVLPGLPTPRVWVQPNAADHPSCPTFLTQFPVSQRRDLGPSTH